MDETPSSIFYNDRKKQTNAKVQPVVPNAPSSKNVVLFSAAVLTWRDAIGSQNIYFVNCFFKRFLSWQTEYRIRNNAGAVLKEKVTVEMQRYFMLFLLIITD